MTTPRASSYTISLGKYETKPAPHTPPPSNATQMIIFRSIPNHRAAGKDGIPSQVLKDLPFRHIIKIAALFQTLANDTDYIQIPPPTRHLATNPHSMIPKEVGATQLSKYRPISLMAQLQKVYTRWLLSQCSATIDAQISEHQSGHGRQRQAAETLYTIQRVIEIHLEWNHPLTILKVDLRKAFDSSSKYYSSSDAPHPHEPPPQIQSRSRAHRQLHHTTNLGLHTRRRHAIQNWQQARCPGKWIPVHTGNAIPPHPAARAVAARQHWFPRRPYHLSHLIFVDDLILVAKTPEQIHSMFTQVEDALSKGGLAINKDKTAYITSLPNRASKCLPGKPHNDTGISILGRQLTLSDNTDKSNEEKQ